MKRGLIFLLSLFFISSILNCGSGNKNTGDKKSGGELKISAKIDPDPPKVGENKIYLEIQDKNGKGVEGAKLTVSPSMPAHGHGSSKDPKISEKGGGKYEVVVVFQMPGEWVVKVEVSSSAGNGSAEFKYTVQK